MDKPWMRFGNAVMDGTLHPLDAKFGVAEGLAKGLEGVKQYFEEHPETLGPCHGTHEPLSSIIERGVPLR